MPLSNGAGTQVQEEVQQTAIEYTHQAQKLAQFSPAQEDDGTGSTQAIEAKFVTPFDAVIVTANGRLPAVPVEEATKLNRLKGELDGKEFSPPRSAVRAGKDGSAYGARLQSPPAAEREKEGDDESAERPLSEAVPASRTNPLFPPLPMYGPPNMLRIVQCWFFRMVSAVLSLGFLLTIIVGAICTSIPKILRNMGHRARLRNPRRQRPFYEEEMKRAQERRTADKTWVREKAGKGTQTPSGEKGGAVPQDGEFIPTEGGPDPLNVDVAYYARRVGLDAEIFEVQTEDGFVIELWHLFNPHEYNQPPASHHEMRSPDVFANNRQASNFAETQKYFAKGKKKYPVLMMHGLLQSAGAFCCNDDDSLAFYLAKSGYDVWLGNNRCGLWEPKHTILQYGDPRMWAWNIRQMGVLDLPALISRVLSETGFEKLALIAHSQGTTQTFVALAKEQRPDIGDKISVFCALAPAAYAGPLIGKIYFKVMRTITPAMFRLVFGIHAFIPLMMLAHKIMPGPLYSWMGYHVFSFLFSWSDRRWDRGLRNRMFQWAPTYVSAESMRWWLGRECFAAQKCILATREEGRLEDKEDEEDDEVIRKAYIDREPHVTERRKLQRNLTSFHCQSIDHLHHDRVRGKFAWYNNQFPPLALWVCGADNLVDGRRLLRRFDRGREPHVRVVHKKIIEGYEHLDVIWAMDAIEKCGKEVREVIWRTADVSVQRDCRVPVGCDKPLEEDPDINQDVPMMYSGGRLRMASISEAVPQLFVRKQRDNKENEGPTMVEHSEEQEGEHDHMMEEKLAYGTNGRRPSEAVFTDLEEKENPLG